MIIVKGYCEVCKKDTREISKKLGITRCGDCGREKKTYWTAKDELDKVEKIIGKNAKDRALINGVFKLFVTTVKRDIEQCEAISNINPRFIWKDRAKNIVNNRAGEL